MRLLLPLTLVFASCGGGSDPKPTEFDPPEGYKARSGEVIYHKHCNLCHGPRGDEGTGGASNLRTSTMDSTAIANLLENGRNGMPKQMHNFESKEEVGNVIDYIKTMRK